MGNKGLVIGDRRSTLTRPSVGSKSPARYVKVGYYIDVSTSRCCPRPASQLTGFLVFPANTRKSRRICPLDLVLFCRVVGRSHLCPCCTRSSPRRRTINIVVREVVLARQIFNMLRPS